MCNSFPDWSFSRIHRLFSPSPWKTIDRGSTVCVGRWVFVWYKWRWNCVPWHSSYYRNVCWLKLQNLLAVKAIDHMQNKGQQTHMPILLWSSGFQVFFFSCYSHIWHWMHWCHWGWHEKWLRITWFVSVIYVIKSCVGYLRYNQYLLQHLLSECI